MGEKPKLASRKKGKAVAEGLAARQNYDKRKADETRRRAVEAADRLLREMDDFIRATGRKPG
jgi:hypothetical protein